MAFIIASSSEWHSACSACSGTPGQSEVHPSFDTSTKLWVVKERLCTTEQRVYVPYRGGVVVESLGVRLSQRIQFNTDIGFPLSGHEGILEALEKLGEEEGPEFIIVNGDSVLPYITF